jgi:hypothetical protein
MTWRSYSLLLALGLAVSARADFNNFDPTKMADVNGKVVDAPVLKYDAIPQPVVGQPTAPQSSKKVIRNNVIDNKNVDVQTLDFPTVPSKTLPRSSVLAKPTVESKAPVATSAAPGQSVVPEPNADTNPRVTPMTTPAGQQELKDEFKK